ncbi:MAG: glycoside hydrolase family 5 protein [Candidatus Zhuqueibacterota bacterium]
MISKMIPLRVFIIFTILVNASLFSYCKPQSSEPDASRNEEVDAFAQNELIARSVNLGNALEAPNEGEWGVTLQSEYFRKIKSAGFTGVRIPIRWSAHAEVDSPYTISSDFLQRVDWAVNEALTNDLAVMINMHHYEEIMEDPYGQKKRFLGLWQQLARHYRSYSSALFFEVLNEPTNKLTAEIWNEFLVEAIRVIRQQNKYRTLVIGTAEWGSFSALKKLVVPEDDTNIIVTFHYYNPFQFTHQGAEWVSGSEQWLGATWRGTANEELAISQELDQVVLWAQQHQRPLFLGEFGAYNKADMASRYAWTNFIAREAEKRDMSWAYWEFCAGFGIYEAGTGQWNYLLDALIP